MKNYALAVPTFNRLVELQKLLASIPATVPVYISDNGATLPESFQSQHLNATVKKISPSVAMFSNWNRAATLVQTEWFAIPSDDDIYYKDSFAIIDQCLNKYAEFDMVVFGHNVIDAAGVVISRWLPGLESCMGPSGFSKFQYGVDARMPSIFMKTAFFRKLGGFCEEFKITAADSDFLQRAALVGNVQFVPEVVAGYRVWDGGLTHKKIAGMEWMNEIDLWCNRIQDFSALNTDYEYPETLGDEIYIANMRAGIMAAKGQCGYISAWRHFFKCRYPHRANLVSQIKLFAHLILPNFK